MLYPRNLNLKRKIHFFKFFTSFTICFVIVQAVRSDIYTKTSFFHVFTQILLFLTLFTYINLDITTDTINTLRVLWTLKVLINTHHLTSITTLHLNTSALASAQYTILNSTYMCWLYWFFQFSWKYTFWAQKTSILDRQYEKHIIIPEQLLCYPPKNKNIST